MTLRVATVQAESIPGDVAANIAAAARLTGEAAASGARLVVFPEAFATGYDATVFTAPLPSMAESSWLAPLQEVVDSTGVIVVLNSAVDHGERRALTDLIVAPHRAAAAAYDKQHLHADERVFFEAGAGGATLVVDGVDVALSVCYDANFPEHAAAAAADGATVYINSGAYFPGGEHRRDLHYASRALDNGMYVVFSGLIGAPSDFIGGSAIFDPLGRRIADVPVGEGIAIVDIDPELVDAVRRDQRMWTDRRPALGARTRFDDAAGPLSAY